MSKELRELCRHKLTPGAKYTLPQVQKLLNHDKGKLIDMSWFTDKLWKVADFEISFGQNPHQRDFRFLRVRESGEYPLKYEGEIPRDQRRGDITKRRNICREAFTLNSNYSLNEIARCMYGTFNHVSRDKVLRDLGEVAYYTFDTSRPMAQILITGIKEPGYVRKTVKKEKEKKSIRIQYSKCVRALLEEKGKCGYLTYDQLSEIYYGLPITDMTVELPNELTNIIYRATRFQICHDIGNLNHAKSTNIIKNYLLYDDNIKAKRPAGEWERKKIKEVTNQFTENPFQHFYCSPYFESYKDAIEQALPRKTYLGVLYKIEFTGNFLHRELYTPEVISNAICTKLDKEILKQIDYHFMNPVCREQSHKAYKDWRTKYIEPHLCNERSIYGS